jgi:hypothetical protein
MRQCYARFRSDETFENGSHQRDFLRMYLQSSNSLEALWSGRRSHCRHQDLRFEDPLGGCQGIRSSCEQLLSVAYTRVIY